MTIDDMATAAEELAREQSLKIRMPELPKTGFCLNCSEGINKNHNFCSSECRQDFERRESQKRAKL